MIENQSKPKARFALRLGIAVEHNPAGTPPSSLSALQ